MQVRVSLIAVLSLSACSLTLPVTGQFNEGGEKFRGEATGRMDGSGTITIRSTTGASCNGAFQYASSKVTGEGGFKCSDGRVGDFFFTSKGTEGEGFGKTTDGKLFEFRFGGPEYTAERQAQWAAIGNSFEQLSRSLNPPTTYCTTFVGSIRCTHYGYR